MTGEVPQRPAEDLLAGALRANVRRVEEVGPEDIRVPRAVAQELSVQPAQLGLAAALDGPPPTHVHLIADLQGRYTNSVVDGTSPWGSPFVPADPTRFLDTRNGTGAPAGRRGANNTLTVKVAGVDGVPADATAVLVNLTGVAPTTATHLTAYGAGALPNASNDNLGPGETRPVLAVIPLDTNGSLHIHNANGSVDIVADLEGYIG